MIGSDCMVFADNKIFGKPKDDAEAKQMLKTLSGNWHKVITGLCVFVERDGIVTKYSTHDITKVKFVTLDDVMIDNYLKTGEHKDKAGAYGIQGQFSKWIIGIDGCYFNVVGLPTNTLNQLFFDITGEHI